MEIKVLICFCLLLVGMPISSAFAAFNRVVSLNPVVSEWVAEILGDGEAKRVMVGVSEYSNYPEYLQERVHVGPYPQLNIEKIAGLKPDLVLGAEEYNRAEQIEQLKRLKLNVRVLRRESFAGMAEWIEELGRALEQPTLAKKAAQKWRDGLAALQKPKAAPVKVFIEIQHVPLITVGGASFLTEALERVGYHNVFSQLESGYPKVSIEAVIKADPDRVFILDHAGSDAELDRSIADWNRFKSLSAVRTRRVTAISGDDFARCSLRLLNALKGLRSSHEGRTP